MAKYTGITRAHFEWFLDKEYKYREFLPDWYRFDWKQNRSGNWEKVSGEIQEYCYIILFSENKCIKVYSSIDRRTDLARERGEDAIRLVAADLQTLKPIHPKFQRINRVGHWEERFRKRVENIVKTVEV